MFVRIKTSPNTHKKYVQIVKSVREGDKVRQKVIQTIGYATDEDTLNRLKDVAEHLKIKLESQQEPYLFESKELADMAIRTKKKKEEQKKQNNHSTSI